MPIHASYQTPKNCSYFTFSTSKLCQIIQQNNVITSLIKYVNEGVLNASTKPQFHCEGDRGSISRAILLFIIDGIVKDARPTCQTNK